MPEQYSQWIENARRRNRPDMAKHHEQLAAPSNPSSATSRNTTSWANYFAHASGDAINPVLAAAGYNFRRLLVAATAGRGAY